MPVGVVTLHLLIPGCTSLKEKRSRLRPLITRLQREFNVSAAEIDSLDSWGEAVVACALVSNDPRFTQRALQKVASWIEKNWFDLELVQEGIEIF